ncbi:acyltransferase [Pelagibius sp. Alg239-R121]|uniref:acyltransferase family protein n=1 Tax=Pelagibius sp. Alg239-R121 TaxID=2993448 RepID=UPI0024A7930D|nr:acyltransferase [Pelagibius sp. Alg239-R121]
MAGKAEASGAAAAYFAFPRSTSAIAELDGLRALAVMLVLGRHAVWPLFSGDAQRLDFSGFDVTVPFLNGWIGVDLFFVLSGFLITHHLLRRGAETPLAQFRLYLGARALRIVPTYLAVMLLVVAGVVPLYQIAPELLSFRVFYHLLFLQDYLPANIVVAFWSLGVEEKFYLLAPFLLLLAVRSGSSVWRYAFLCGLIFLPFLLRVVTNLQHPEITEYGAYFPVFRSPFHLTFDGLAVGVFCAFVSHEHYGFGRKQGLRWPIPLFWAAALLLLFQLFGWELLEEAGIYEKLFQPLVLSITFGGMLLAAVQGGAPRLLLGNRCLLVVARISYPLYLIHIPLVPLALAMTGYRVEQGFDGFLGFFAGFWALSFLAAFALHFSVEKPFLLLKDRLSQKHPWRMRPDPQLTPESAKF